MKIAITGGAGFIGSCVVKLALKKNFKVLNIDSLSYAGNKNNLKDLTNIKNYQFIKADILNYKKIYDILSNYKPDYIMHLAASSHVDNSISSPREFLKVNIEGTFNLLEICRDLLSNSKFHKNFKFHYISTDEVYGSAKTIKFDEKSIFNPQNPYSSTKASAEHLVKAWGNTYNIPYLISNCSNNYGPFQHPEKLIPKAIINALRRKKIPIYGKGKNIRDWLHVHDHAECLFEIAYKGKIGEKYNIGAENEIQNINIVKKICKILDKKFMPKKSYSELISFIEDRPGHDLKYSINPSKVNKNLSWYPKINFNEGLFNTVEWYIKNEKWWKKLI